MVVWVSRLVLIQPIKEATIDVPKISEVVTQAHGHEHGISGRKQMSSSWTLLETLEGISEVPDGDIIPKYGVILEL